MFFVHWNLLIRDSFPMNICALQPGSLPFTVLVQYLLLLCLSSESGCKIGYISKTQFQNNIKAELKRQRSRRYFYSPCALTEFVLAKDGTWNTMISQWADFCPYWDPYSLFYEELTTKEYSKYNLGWSSVLAGLLDANLCVKM